MDSRKSDTSRQAKANPPYRIIYVDDDDDYGKLFVGLALHLGHEVNFYSKPADVLKALSSVPSTCDVVVSDLQMRDIDGLDLASDIRNLGLSIPVSIVTSEVESPRAREAASLGFLLPREKPTTVQQLQLLLDRIFAGKKCPEIGPGS